ncbi:monooxygenase [Cnuibacter physcomitrellae]|uniref:Monooxygenase n=1 Tax=Cnuibacter physcomitrellae TaxID=1619308 RepID=A0A1X9LIQ0_9MICO|nr:flavin reductase family protein [Cnuibacter physcomitrellae]ARJ04188.1 monooxygenase [Cnuibacter physcomitrellae]GGI40458.1 monooxygenase [Cnuibacter physcomitrellae]
MPIDPQTFRTIMGHYPTGVCVVTAVTPEGTAVGMTVGTFTSVSLDPPLIGFFPDRRSTSWPGIAAAGRFCVNVLADDQEHLGRQFASKGGDKFVGVAHRVSDSGLPLLDGAVAWIECSLYSVGDAGDHVLVLGEVETLSAEHTASPLVFHKGAFRQVAYPVPAVA